MIGMKGILPVTQKGTQDGDMITFSGIYERKVGIKKKENVRRFGDSKVVAEICIMLSR